MNTTPVRGAGREALPGAHQAVLRREEHRVPTPAGAGGGWAAVGWVAGGWGGTPDRGQSVNVTSKSSVDMVERFRYGSAVCYAMGCSMA